MSIKVLWSWIPKFKLPQRRSKSRRPQRTEAEQIVNTARLVKKYRHKKR